MRIYTVHIKPDSEAPDRDARFVKQGFCWPAFFFRWLWAFATGLWLEGLVILGIEIVLATIVGVVGVDPISSLAIVAGWYVLLGSVGNDLRRWNLTRRGYSEAATVAERTRDQAERRFFEHVGQQPNAIGGALP